MTILRASNIRKRFGGVVALTRGDLDLEEGEVHVLIGSNGCGKSTLCKIIAGSVGLDSGTLEIGGQEARFRNPHEAAAAGIGVFYQELSLIPQLTVAENILLGREPVTAAGLIDQGRLRAAAAAAIEPFAAVAGEGFGPDVPVADLSADQRQIVEILKVLSEDPKILIFDEATSSLDNRQVEVFFDIVRTLKGEGRSVIFISHRMDELFAIGDRVTVMRNGETVATLSIADTTRDEVVGHMVGGALASEFERKHGVPAGAADAGDVVLAVRDLGGTRLRGVSFELRRGEILGLGGLHGQGQSELLRTLFGAVRARTGTIAIDGEAVAIGKPADAMRRSIAYVSGDRGRHGVFPIRPIFENLVLASLGGRAYVDRGGFIDRIMPVAERLKLKFSSLSAPVAELSGGNQQKVVIGRWLATTPRILLLDDPTKGIDLETKHDLYAIMDELCAEGVSIILYSSEDTELLSNADRILVFNSGRIMRELAGDTANEFELYQAAYAAG